MVDHDDAHVVDLRDESAHGEIAACETVATRRSWLGPALAVLAAAVVAVLLVSGDDREEGEPAAAPAAPAAQATAEPGAADAAERSAPSDGTSAAEGGRTIAIPPVESAMSLLVATRPIDDGPIDFIRVDSATGAATALDNRALLGLAEVQDIRFFGPDAAVAELADGSYLTVAIGVDDIEIASLVDVTRTAAVTPLGLDALSPDGRHAWVASPYGFFLWDLIEDRIVSRWLDRDGDLARLPTPRLAVASGLVVDAGGDAYLIEGSTARRLDIGGEVVAGADDWVLTRSCDATLDCGALELVDLASSATVGLREERFRQRCGLMAPVPPGSLGADDAVAVVLQRFGSSAVIVADGDGVSSVTALHPLPVGCIDASVLDDGRVVVFSDTTIAYVDGDDVAVVTTFSLGRTLAGTAVAAST